MHFTIYTNKNKKIKRRENKKGKKRGNMVILPCITWPGK
jgi:hypothetical protein